MGDGVVKHLFRISESQPSLKKILFYRSWSLQKNWTGSVLSFLKNLQLVFFKVNDINENCDPHLNVDPMTNSFQHDWSAFFAQPP